MNVLLTIGYVLLGLILIWLILRIGYAMGYQQCYKDLGKKHDFDKWPDY